MSLGIMIIYYTDQGHQHNGTLIGTAMGRDCPGSYLPFGNISWLIRLLLLSLSLANIISGWK